MTEIKILDIKKFALGVDIENFLSPYKAIISPPALYNGKHVYQILKYESSVHYYKFNGDGFSFYEPTQPTKKSSFFINFKPIILFENERAKLSTIKFSDEYTNLVCISFSLELFEIKERMYGVIKLFTFVRPNCKYFGLSNNIFNVEVINKEETFKIFNELSKMNIIEIQENYWFIKEIKC